MVICPDCGKDVPESKFCKNCGAYIKDVKSPAEPNGKFGFCPNCGHGLDGDYSFCPECGADISSDNEVNAADEIEKEEPPIEEEDIESVDADDAGSDEVEDINPEEIGDEVSVESGDVEEEPPIEGEDIESVDADDAGSDEVEDINPEGIGDEVSVESGDVEEESPIEGEDIESVDSDDAGSDEVKETESIPGPVQSSDNIRFCFNCGSKLVGDYKFCPECGQDLSGKTMRTNAQTANSPSSEKNTLLAVILSLFLPGLGQIYLGLDHKGAIFLIAYVVSAILILVLVGFLLCFVIWIWALVDTIISANAINRGDEVQDKIL